MKKIVAEFQERLDRVYADKDNIQPFLEQSPKDPDLYRLVDKAGELPATNFVPVDSLAGMVKTLEGLSGCDKAIIIGSPPKNSMADRKN